MSSWTDAANACRRLAQGRYVLELADHLGGTLDFTRIGHVGESLPLDLARRLGRVDVELSTCVPYI